MLNVKTVSELTLLFLHFPDRLQLLDNWWEGVGDDGDHDEEGEQENEDSWHDMLDVLDQFL